MHDCLLSTSAFERGESERVHGGLGVGDDEVGKPSAEPLENADDAERKVVVGDAIADVPDDGNAGKASADPPE